jgi:5-methylcytosine-specific restriction endonuclease McrA
MADRVYATKRWREVRRMVLERDGYRCQIGSHVCTGEATAVDHIVSWRDGGAPYSLLNLRASCKPCNSSRVSTSKANAAPVVPSREY